MTMMTTSEIDRDEDQDENAVDDVDGVCDDDDDDDEEQKQ